jgi:ABC-type antimicrobial peptide transport system permease subunit
VRIALGAGRSTVLFMVLKQALVLVLIGLVLGLAGAFAGGELLRSMLCGVKPLDPAVLAAACCLIGLTGALAAYVPARRATKIDPMEALRYE